MGKPAPITLILWDMAERFGWTLEYIDSLPLERLHEWIEIEDARYKAREYVINKKGGAKSARK